eukprot:118035-Hanusia_phi.AAC.2
MPGEDAANRSAGRGKCCWRGESTPVLIHVGVYFHEEELLQQAGREPSAAGGARPAGWCRCSHGRRAPAVKAEQTRGRDGAAGHPGLVVAVGHGHEGHPSLLERLRKLYLSRARRRIGSARLLPAATAGKNLCFLPVDHAGYDEGSAAELVRLPRLKRAIACHARVVGVARIAYLAVLRVCIHREDVCTRRSAGRGDSAALRKEVPH